MKKNLILIILVGFIVGMFLMTPTFAVGDVFLGGLMVGGLAWLIAFFALKQGQNKELVK